MGDTDIQWTGKTWNPLRGCTEISPGCAHCYAAAVAARFSGPGLPYEGLAYFDDNGKAHWTGKLRIVPEKLAEPLHWRKPAKIFVNSMSDLFHEKVPFTFVDEVFAIMASCERHTFQVLTKRPERMARYFSERSLGDVYTNILCLADAEPAYGPSPHDRLRSILKITDMWSLRDGKPSRHAPPPAWPLPNVWLGVSVEDQKRADERIPHLLRTPAAIRFLSIEPMLEAIDLNRMETMCETWRKGFTIGTYLDWVIVGGESGHNARPLDLAWARSIRDQCKSAGVAFFMKQCGSRPFDSRGADGFPGASKVYRSAEEAKSPGAIAALAITLELMTVDLKDSHGGDMAEWPSDLRVREFPAVSEVARA